MLCAVRGAASRIQHKKKSMGIGSLLLADVARSLVDQPDRSRPLSRLLSALFLISAGPTFAEGIPVAERICFSEFHPNWRMINDSQEIPGTHGRSQCHRAGCGSSQAAPAVSTPHPSAKKVHHSHTKLLHVKGTATLIAFRHATHVTSPIKLYHQWIDCAKQSTKRWHDPQGNRLGSPLIERADPRGFHPHR